MRRISFIVAAVGALIGCSASTPVAQTRVRADEGKLQRYRLEGTVVRFDKAEKMATIKHGPIANAAGEVWMEPMTMEFPVPKEADLAKLKAGVAITAVVVTREEDLAYWIQEVMVK